MQPVAIYKYLMLTRRQVFDKVRSLSPEQYNRSFSFGLKTIGSTLAHLMTSEWYYIQHLEGRDVPPYEHWPIHYENPPELDVIEQTWHEQEQRISNVIASERNWQRTITWLSFPDDARDNKHFHITCTAGDLFTQLALHEVRHRAQILVMLRELGTPLTQDIDYNALMYHRVEAQ